MIRALAILILTGLSVAAQPYYLSTPKSELPDISALFAPGPGLYRLVIVGTRNDGLPEIALVFRTNVVSARIYFHRNAPNNDWGGETTIQNTGVGITNRIGYCYDSKPLMVLLKVEILP